MSETTPNLGLFKYNPITDGKETFSIQAALNDNWDIIDEKCSRGSGFNLFDTKITDHILQGDSAVGWVLQGSYVNGAVYPDFYAKCIEEYNEATNTETINGVTVKVHSNGHKFYNISDKTAIDESFNTIGSAWFYGVDIENERIFLPRDKYFAVKGDVSVAGNGMTLGLTDGTNEIGFKNFPTYYLASGSQNIEVGQTSDNKSVISNAAVGVTTDPTKSGIEGKLTANTDKYLYICVGNTIVNEEQIDVSKVLSEAVLRSSLEEVQTIIETYKNGTSWYRIWSDGWCEQGGTNTNDANIVITLLKPYRDTNYSVIATPASNNTKNSYFSAAIGTRTTTQFNISFSNGITGNSCNHWQTSGYIW